VTTPRIVFDPAALTQLVHSPTGDVAKDLKRRGLRVQRAVKRSLHQAGTGRVYGHHTASAPGQPPATDTGRLAASIVEELGRDEHGLVERIGTDVDYALPLELGTRNMEPRPFLRPGLQAARDGGTA
jgi:hypothetical protein